MKYPFSEFLRILGKGPKSRRSLTEEEAKQAVKMVLEGQVTDRQLGAFLLLMRANGESQAELVGFLTGLRNHYQLNTSNSGVELDISAYAGKWRYPPYFLLSVKLLAESGYRVLLHGDSGQFTDRHYAEDFAKTLGFYIAHSREDAQQQMTSSRPIYLPLEAFAPELKQILHLKEELGVRTVFNTAVKLLNPLNAKCSMQGIFHKGVENLHHAAASVNGTEQNLVFKGEGGEPEIRPDALSHLYFSSFTPPLTSLTDQTIEALVERQARPKQWQPEDLLALWQDKSKEVYGYYAVIGTAAAALMLLEGYHYKEATEQACALWERRQT